MLARKVLPNRRPNIGERLFHGGQTFFLQFGFDEAGKVREIFCASKKSTADLAATLESTCIVLSKALQIGVNLTDLADSVSYQDGFIAAILKRAATVERECGADAAATMRGVA